MTIYPVCTVRAYNMLRLLARRSSEDESRTMMESSTAAATAAAVLSLSALGDSMMTDSSLLELEEEACLARLMRDSLSAPSFSSPSSS